jgi:hypothetical protein
MLSKEKIQELHNYFEQYGSGEYDAAPLVETARMAHKLLEVLKGCLALRGEDDFELSMIIKTAIAEAEITNT